MLGIKNIGILVTGDIAKPVSDATAILIDDGKIVKMGPDSILDGAKLDKVIDANGTTVAPGLIDSHVHPVLGDFSPRQSILNWINSSMHGGVTSMISAGEPHTPGRPKDPSGTKALAIVCHKSAENARPGGVKLHGGAVILEKGLVEKDFEEMAKEGVFIVGEIGLGSVKDPKEANQMVQWARKNGMKVQMHTGGTSIPGSSTVTADMVIVADPDVVSHVNGGPTSISEAEIDKLVDTKLTLEVVQCGNFKTMQYAANKMKEKGQLSRLIMGNDSPSGTGIIPLGILRNIAYVASMTAVSGAEAICCATGNTAKVYGLSCGILAEGKDADIVLMDAPMGGVGKTALEAIEAGDVPGVSIVLVDGKVMFSASRNTPPVTRKPTVA
ncbi:MAG: amidohydrolase family protein [Planctomycetaceae bacterium]|nr:amidohydrolase family protein [Planctomycetaceae bacterium]